MLLYNKNGETDTYPVLHWNRIARSRIENVATLVIVTDVAKNKRGTTGMASECSRGCGSLDRANAPNIAHVSSTVNVNVDLFAAKLNQTTLLSRNQFQEHGVVVVAVFEVKALLSLLEPLLRRRQDFPRRWRRSNNIAINILHGVIIKLETRRGLGAGKRGRWTVPLYSV